MRLALRTSPFATALTVLGASLAIGLAAQIEVPLHPVPITFQTYAVVMAGALLGSRLGFAAAALYLLEGACGLPVFAGGAAGPQHLAGPTAGYLIAFPLAAWLAGVAAEHGRLERLVTALPVLLGAQLVVLAVGAAWLSLMIGLPAALTGGVLPFLIGALLKAGLCAATLKLLPGRA